MPQREHRDVSLLGDVEDAAELYRSKQEQLADAREKLYGAIRRAASEGVPFSKIAAAAKLSAERVRQIVAGE